MISTSNSIHSLTINLSLSLAKIVFLYPQNAISLHQNCHLSTFLFEKFFCKYFF